MIDSASGPRLMGHFVSEGEGERIPWPDVDFHVKASGAETGGALTVLEDGSPAGRISLHVHHHEDEAFYVLQGQITITCGDRTFLATPGSFVFLPRGVPHAQDIHPGGARKLIIAVPGGIEGFFREIGQGLTAGSMSGELWADISRRHGIEWLE